LLAQPSSIHGRHDALSLQKNQTVAPAHDWEWSLYLLETVGFIGTASTGPIAYANELNTASNVSSLPSSVAFPEESAS
jgi:hypothetical protein